MKVNPDDERRANARSKSAANIDCIWQKMRSQGSVCQKRVSLESHRHARKKEDTDITTYGMVQMDNQHPSGMVSSTGLESHLHLVTIKSCETCFGTGTELEARKPNQMNIAENDVKR